MLIVGKHTILQAIVLIPLAGVCTSARAVDWPQSYHDAGRTGFNPQEATLSVSNVKSLQRNWSHRVDCGTVAFALDNGTIYALGQGDCNGNWELEALDAMTGAKAWKVTTGNGNNFPVVTTNSRLVFTVCGFADSGGNNYGAVCAYNKLSGKRAWKWGNPCNCLPEAGVQSAPAYSNGVVYFGYANGGAGGSEYVVAADASSGSTIWTHGFGTSNTLGTADVAAGNDTVYVNCAPVSAHLVCALSKKDGSLLWSTDTGAGTTGGTLSVDKSTVYVTPGFGSANVVALDSTTGTQKWAFGEGQTGNNRHVAIGDGDVYYTSDDGHVFDLRARDGKMKWSLAITDARSAPSLANGVLYVERDRYSKSVSAFDAATGAPLWNSGPTSTTLWPPPIIANGILYGANGDCGGICAYALP